MGVCIGIHVYTCDCAIVEAHHELFMIIASTLTFWFVDII